jgi:N,N'-diacetyllegionaminate synthase
MKKPKTLIIAEVGPNHNGSLKLAYKYIDVCKKIGADIVKFQTSVPHLHISKFAEMAKYQIKNCKYKSSQLKMAKKISLPLEDFIKLKKYCLKKKIGFLSTPFDIKSINLLNKIKLNCFKIPSGEITNLPYLREIGRLNKKIIISTGMANLKEIENAIKVLIKSGTSKKKISILHCNTEYPTPYKDVNLKAMKSLEKKFRCPVGYSDHTTGIEIPIAAVALGASIIEKHITLNKNMKGPDHKASIEPKDFENMIKGIRIIEKSLGDGIKKASSSEIKNIPIARKSIVALTKIKKGEVFSEKNLTVKRPGTGLSPMLWDRVLGKKSHKDYIEDQLI